MYMNSEALSLFEFATNTHRHHKHRQQAPGICQRTQKCNIQTPA